MSTDFTISKSNIECYKIRHTSGMYWADITIDSKDTAGRIQIASDYGSWQNYWNACGMPFKEFLIKIGIDYFANKVGESKWFDFDKTIRMYKQYVLNERKREFISSESARKMFDEIKLLDENGNSAFTQVMYSDCPELMKQFDHCPDTCTDISPLFRKFWDKIWSLFILELKSELSLVPAQS